MSRQCEGVTLPLKFEPWLGTRARFGHLTTFTLQSGLLLPVGSNPLGTNGRQISHRLCLSRGDHRPMWRPHDRNRHLWANFPAAANCGAVRYAQIAIYLRGAQHFCAAWKEVAPRLSGSEAGTVRPYAALRHVPSIRLIATITADSAAASSTTALSDRE